MSVHEPSYIIQETHQAIITKIAQKCMQAGKLLERKLGCPIEITWYNQNSKKFSIVVKTGYEWKLIYCFSKIMFA